MSWYGTTLCQIHKTSPTWIACYPIIDVRFEQEFLSYFFPLCKVKASSYVLLKREKITVRASICVCMHFCQCCGQLWVWHMFCSGLVSFASLCHNKRAMCLSYHWMKYFCIPVIRLYSEIHQIHLSIEGQCGTACWPLGDCHSQCPFAKKIYCPKEPQCCLCVVYYKTW